MKVFTKRERFLIWLASFLVIWAVGGKCLWEPVRLRLSIAQMERKEAFIELEQILEVKRQQDTLHNEYQKEEALATEHQGHFPDWMPEEGLERALILQMDASNVTAEKIQIKSQDSGADEKEKTGQGYSMCQAEVIVRADLEELVLYLDRLRSIHYITVAGCQWNEAEKDYQGKIPIVLYLDIWLLSPKFDQGRGSF